MRYESGETEPLLDDLKRIAEALKIEPYMLYDDYYRFLDYPYSKRIKEIRNKKNLSRKQLGDMLGMSRRTVAHWENETNAISREKWEQLKNLELL